MPEVCTKLLNIIRLYCYVILLLCTSMRIFAEFSRKEASNDSGVARQPMLHASCINEVYLVCVRNKSAGSLDIGVGHWCRSLRQ